MMPLPRRQISNQVGSHVILEYNGKSISIISISEYVEHEQNLPQRNPFESNQQPKRREDFYPNEKSKTIS